MRRGKLPECFTITHKRRITGGEDRQGNSVVSFADPVERKIITAYPPGPDEITRAEQTGQVQYLYVLSNTKWGGHADLVVFEKNEYEMLGSPEDFTHHPWGFSGGYRMKLRRVDG